ncbi:MAG: hypothetical protein AB7E29_07575 [Xanthobacter sp.]
MKNMRVQDVGSDRLFTQVRWFFKTGQLRRDKCMKFGEKAAKLA